MWDARSGRQVGALETAAPVTAFDVSFDRAFVTTAEANTVRVWDAAALRQLRQLDMPYPVESASFAPATGRLVAGGDDMWVHLHDFATGEELAVNKGHHGPVHTVKFSPTGDTYASGSEDGTIRMWSLAEVDAAAAVNGGGH